ncbi:hypothetical protein [Streptomyces goshikiensis]|uniref:hypothetical protein n=1 Tax=Streptomyces goshikiensis TaxID=1942 RepID=UPI00365B93A4
MLGEGLASAAGEIVAEAGMANGTGPHALRHHYAEHGEPVKTISEHLRPQVDEPA